MHKKQDYVSDYSSRPLLDKRRLKHDSISLDHVFYVVHLISMGDDTWHQVSLVAVDTDDPFHDGLNEAVSEIQESVAKELNYTGKLNETDHDSLLVHPIFIRNLNADHRNVVEALEVTKISAELSSLISTKPDLMLYVVVGITTGKDKTTRPFLTSIRACNAVEAIERATVAVQMDLSCDFRALFATIQAPVTSTLFAKYASASKKIRDFVEATPKQGSMLH